MSFARITAVFMLVNISWFVAVPGAAAGPDSGVTLTEKARTDRTESMVTGVLLIIGGAAVVGSGVALWLLPMQDALDKRDSAHKNWLAATSPDELMAYQPEIEKQDERANTYFKLGWVGTGIGAAMVVGGILALVLAPEVPQPGGDDPENGEASLRPYVTGSGGGIVLEMPW